jgi:peptide/nickel transport system substrate-binding protein
MILLAVALLALGAACGDGDRDDEPSQSSSAAATAAGSTPAAAVQPRGELRIAADFLPALLDPAKAFNLIKYGAGETLTRITPDLTVEPWLAERVTSVDASTWRVTLRPNAKFHDGSPVDAEAVAASFRRTWELAPSSHGFISKDTQLTVVDPRTLEFKTPQPSVAFPNMLSVQQFVVHKVAGDSFPMTGPYRPVRLAPDEMFELAAFPEHWGGTPPIARATARLVRDANARALALQSGDADMLLGLPVEMVGGLSADFEKPVVVGTRTQYVLFNHTRPPFDDRAVREAFSLGIDRNTLNKVAQDGQGRVLAGIFPPVPGIDAVAVQSTDLNRARQVLDQAGWMPGSDGVRAKDGRRLAVTLYSYPQRADLTPMAVSIQAQLKPLGFDIRIEQTQDITKTLQGGDFEAAMYSFNVLATADPLYGLGNELGTGGGQNFGKYANAQIDQILTRMRDELDPGRRNALSREAQELTRADVPNAYLVAPPLIYAYRKGKVRNFTPHPIDIYLLDGKVAVQ